MTFPIDCPCPIHSFMREQDERFQKEAQEAKAQEAASRPETVVEAARQAQEA